MPGGGLRREWWGRHGSAVTLFASILSIAAIARVAWFVLFSEADQLRGDEVYYVKQAQALVDAGTYPGALRPPLQSALIASVFLVHGTSVAAARFVGIFVSLVTVALVVEVARARLGTRAAVAAGVLCALHPSLLHYSHLLWSENLYAMLLMATVCCLERFDRLRVHGWLVGAGIALGLAALTRETALYLVPVAMAWLWKADGLRARPPLLLLLGAALVVAPWMLRNAALYGGPPTISTNRWRMIAQGNVAEEARRQLRARAGEDFVYRRRRDTVVREQIARTIALRAIVERQPWWLFEKIHQSTRDLLLTKLQLARYAKRRWLPADRLGLARIVVRVDQLMLALLVCAGIAGAWLAGAGRLQGLVVAILLTHWLIFVVAFAHNRFLVPLLPLLALLAGPMLTRWPPWGRAASWRLAGAAGSLLFLAIVLSAG
ncbi:glycosyltransferase family 39 protein [Candidatus Binatia bacterium]|nr:glycosyltransferase family 39 protein [Candidatus Binatia bacterium]